MKEVEYLKGSFILYIHLVAIDEEFCEYDGHSKYKSEMRGIKDYPLLDSAINEPKKSFDGQDLYPDIISKASCYLRSLAMNHPFYDGNKRTALLSTIIFLEINGFKITGSDEELYRVTREIVEEKSSIDEIKEKIKPYIRVSGKSKMKEAFKKINSLFDR